MNHFTIPTAETEKSITWNRISTTIGINTTQIIKDSVKKTYHSFDFTGCIIELSKDRVFTPINIAIDSNTVHKILVSQTVGKIPDSVIPRMVEVAKILGLSDLVEVDLKILCLNLIVLSYYCDLRQKVVKRKAVLDALKGLRQLNFIGSPIYTHLRTFAIDFENWSRPTEIVNCAALLEPVEPVKPVKPVKSTKPCKFCGSVFTPGHMKTCSKKPADWKPNTKETKIKKQNKSAVS